MNERGRDLESDYMLLSELWAAHFFGGRGLCVPSFSVDTFVLMAPFTYL